MCYNICKVEGVNFLRLKIKNLNRAIAELTSAELSLYIYIAQRSDRTGIMTDLSMRDVCLKTGLSKQHFYNCLDNLSEKGFLYISQTKVINFDIILIDNKFSSDNDSSEPYLNLNYNFLSNLIFHRLPMGIKKFILRAFSFNSTANNRNWRISIDTLKSYKIKVDDLHEFFDIRSMNDSVFSFRLKSNFIKQSFNTFYIFYEHRLKNILHRRKTTYTTETLRDSVQTISNFRNYQGIINYAISLPDHKYSVQPKLLTYIISLYRDKLELA